MSTSSTPTSDSPASNLDIYARVIVHGMPMVRCISCGHWNYIHDPECELDPQPQPQPQPPGEVTIKEDRNEEAQGEDEGEQNEFQDWATVLMQRLHQIGASDL